MTEVLGCVRCRYTWEQEENEGTSCPECGHLDPLTFVQALLQIRLDSDNENIPLYEIFEDLDTMTEYYECY